MKNISKIIVSSLFLQQMIFANEAILLADSNTVEVTTENRVQNGSFESGDNKPDMWEVSNASFTRSSEDAVDGKYSLQFSPKGRRSTKREIQVSFSCMRSP
jgi:hypothetical protein